RHLKVKSAFSTIPLLLAHMHRRLTAVQHHHPCSHPQSQRSVYLTSHRRCSITHQDRQYRGHHHRRTHHHQPRPAGRRCGPNREQPRQPRHHHRQPASVGCTPQPENRRRREHITHGRRHQRCRETLTGHQRVYFCCCSRRTTHRSRSNRNRISSWTIRSVPIRTPILRIRFNRDPCNMAHRVGRPTR